MGGEGFALALQGVGQPPVLAQGFLHLAYGLAQQRLGFFDAVQHRV